MKKILFIEDDALVGRMYQCSLQSEGFHVDLVSDGETGLAALRHKKPDLVLLDLMLPKVSGLSILKHIRAQPETNPLPVVVLSNGYLSQMMEEADRLGANMCLIKAETTPAMLAHAVRSAISPAGLAGGDRLPPPKRPAAPRSEFGESLAAPDPKRAFAENAQNYTRILNALVRELIRIDDPTTRNMVLADMYRKAHSLAGSAALAGAQTITRMATALEALLKELEETPVKITPSSIRTASQATELLSSLASHSGHLPARQPSDPFSVLVVDDDIVTLKTVAHALTNAGIKSRCVEDPLVAHRTFGSECFDLAIIDVKMPGMDGFELCRKMRELPTHQRTPVIFLTRLCDFENRMRSAMSGGSDFIAKPFLFMELTVKVLIHVLQRRAVAQSAKDPAFQPFA